MSAHAAIKHTRNESNVLAGLSEIVVVEGCTATHDEIPLQRKISVIYDGKTQFLYSVFLCIESR